MDVVGNHHKCFFKIEIISNTSYIGYYSFDPSQPDVPIIIISVAVKKGEGHGHVKRRGKVMGECLSEKAQANDDS